MVLLLIKPITNSQRNLVLLNKKVLNKKSYLKKNIKGFAKNSGINNFGKKTVFAKKNCFKFKNRTVQFFRSNITSGIVTSIEYDPNRTANIASIFDFLNNKYFYMISSKNLKPGNIVKSCISAEQKLGHSLPIFKIPVGSFINGIAPKRKTFAQISRSAGSFSTVLKKTTNYAVIKTSSKQLRKISLNCFAVLGIVSNQFYFLTTISKAGRSNWLKKGSKVRGVAKNPIDHYNGGGEGKKSGKALLNWKKSSTRSKNMFIFK